MAVSLLVGTVKGAFLLRSDHAREHWTVAGPLLKGWKVTASGRDTDSGYLLATGSDVYGPAVHRSGDLLEWKQVENGPAYGEESGFKLNQIWTFARAGERLYAGVDEAGLFRSDDGGDTWTQVEGLTSHSSREAWFPGFGGLCAHCVLVDPADHDRLWVGISAVGVFHSSDGGRRWTPRNQGVRVTAEDEQHEGIGTCVHSLCPDPDDADRIYRQDHSGMYRTGDGGLNWEPIENGLPSGFGFPLVMHRASKTLYVFPLESDEYRMPVDGAMRVYRSRDGGDSWEPLIDGLPQEHAHMNVLRGAMAVDQLDPGGIYMGTTNGELYASIDGGSSWRALPVSLPRILSVEAYA